ncbi:DUF5134 domain-containing protein [Streptomyces sp. JJ36]|uniref:DUF5134 domain-containing protein n=1 Tax=Streptomyces sp. JJ36 TaxID=2736645 RepID=UPI001F461F2F|nr:DUF5134 domain-containing protein [Streptomyces sp. JJ36]MCF6525963.1 DUF5134 domain-containing protein [Streptomyces sp. JJ36]
MHGSAVVSWLLVAVCGVTGTYCLLRVWRRSAEHRRAAWLEAVMGLGMAVMALPHTVAPVPPAGFVVLFGASTAVALHGAARSGAHCLHHALESLAMVYMALVMAGAVGSAAPAAHAGHPAGPGHAATPGGIPLLTGALLLYFAAYVLRSGALLAGAPAGRGRGRAAPAPHEWGTAGAPLAHACRLTLALGSFTMLLTL